ncbi:MAG: ABC transporter ATP-binding protein [Coriobacteriia bacterium]|nr:ABC transporter ATP-binding protein [Coriobacteriia bacterium]
MADPLLQVKHLKLSFNTDNGKVQALNDVSFNLDKGKVVCIVGESGSGKSITAYSILQILGPGGHITGGSIKFEGKELIGCSESDIRAIRGNRISMIFQDPMTSMNPTFTVGKQIMEAILLHTDRNNKQAKERAIEMLKLVGINEPEKRLKQYPHELSGGMRQRAMIAMALACEPDILIADEPTTALDVTIQAQILELMLKLKDELGMSIIMITHDMGVVAQMADDVVVMYAGSICEKGTADDVFNNPRHEYTRALLRSLPSPNVKSKRLKTIEGSPIDLLHMPKGCAFAPRCKYAMKVCMDYKPYVIQISDTQKAKCWSAIRTQIEDGSFKEDECPDWAFEVLNNGK